MIERNSAADQSGATVAGPVEPGLREALARERSGVRSAAEALPLLLDGGDDLLGHDTVARISGMLDSLAEQLGIGSGANENDRRTARITLARDPDLLGFLHGHALEFRLALRFARDTDGDTVSSTVLRNLMNGQDRTLSALSVDALAAQARFVAAVARMEMPLSELPAEMFSSAAAIMGADRGELRTAYHEGRSRLALLARLVASTRDGEPGMLDSNQAGLALFLTVLAATSGYARSDLTMAIAGGKVTTLALAMKLAGLTDDRIVQECALLMPGAIVPSALDQIDIEAARRMLSPTDGAKTS